MQKTRAGRGGLGPAYALGLSSFFKKYEWKNLEFFTLSSQNDFGNLCSSLIEQIGFPFFEKNRPHFQETKVNFLFKVFNKIGKTEFSFLINRSDHSSKHQRIHYSEFHDKISVANDFT